MTLLPARRLLLPRHAWFAGLCLVAALSAAEKPTPTAPRTGENTFSLLPKSLQQNPELEMTFWSELTDYGRTLTAATPEKPVYYVAQDGGRRQLGAGARETQLPKPEFLGRMLDRALATNGYLPASPPAREPQLALVYHWGSFLLLDEETRDGMLNITNDAEGNQSISVSTRNHYLDRALLIGGKKFREHLARKVQFGATQPASTKEALLEDQARRALYFVIVSAYDYAALARGDRRLAWRMNLTVNSDGVNMLESLPTLVLSAAPFFGRDMSESEFLVRTVRRGEVDIGTLEVIESDVKTEPTPKP